MSGNISLADLNLAEKNYYQYIKGRLALAGITCCGYTGGIGCMTIYNDTAQLTILTCHHEPVDLQLQRFINTWK